MGFGSIASAIGGAGSFGLGTALSMGQGLLAYQGQRETNKANMTIANDTNAMAERLSSTAYQRGMADMKKAGLNPILAGKLGGASTPGLNMPVMHSELGAGVQGMQQGISSANDIARTSAETSLKDAQEAVTRVDETLKNLRIPREQIYNQLWLFAKEGIQEAKRKGTSFMDWLSGSGGSKFEQWLESKDLTNMADDFRVIMKVLSEGQIGIINKMLGD